jgi:hypothetical protein
VISDFTTTSTISPSINTAVIGQPTYSTVTPTIQTTPTPTQLPSQAQISQQPNILLTNNAQTLQTPQTLSPTLSNTISTTSSANLKKPADVFLSILGPMKHMIMNQKAKAKDCKAN